MGAIADLYWDTDTVRPHERFPYFVEGICRAFTQLDLELPDEETLFSVRIRHREVADSGVTRVYSSKYIVRNLPACIARSEHHDFYLHYIADGTIDALQGGQSDAVPGGNMFVLDNARPFELSLRARRVVDTHIVRLSRTPLLERQSAELLAFGRRYAGHRLMPLLRMNLVQLARSGDSATHREIGFFGRTVAHLVDLILSDDSIETIPSRSRGAWRFVRTEIDRHIGDQDFTLEILAANLGVSVRYVQKVCAAQQCTFSGYLRDRRLELAAQRLREKADRVSVEGVALACGFREVSTFYRAFKSRYGMTPGDFRH